MRVTLANRVANIDVSVLV